MKTVKILHGQTLIDIAVQEMGDASKAIALAALNEINVTDRLVAGETIEVPDYDKSNRSIVNLFADDANKPASDLSGNETSDVPSGIGYWYIENDFVVQ